MYLKCVEISVRCDQQSSKMERKVWDRLETEMEDGQEQRRCYDGKDYEILHTVSRRIGHSKNMNKMLLGKDKGC